MEVITFIEKIILLRTRFLFSVTSWGRTPKRNKLVGGKENSKHLSLLAVDVVLDDPSFKDAFIEAARSSDLKCIDEGDHIHVQV